MNSVAWLLFLIPLNIFSQDLTGTWIGSGGGAPYLKLVIIQKGDSCYGYTYDEGPGFCKADFEGKFDKANQKLKGRGTKFIERSFGHILAAYNLNYQKRDNDEYLAGTLRPKGLGSTMLSLGIPSYGQLRKMANVVDTSDFMRDKINASAQSIIAGDSLQSPVNTDIGNVAKKLPDTITMQKSARISETLRIINSNSDTVRLMVYDNGIVDNDTVTIYFDNRVILDRFGISEKGKELYIPLTKNGEPHTVELFANNLGSIPPNTALLIITAGKERYEVHASYDLSTNAKIIFRYKQ